MSGGAFDYLQYRINDIIDGIEECISENKHKEYYQFSEETINEFRKGIELLKRSKIYTQRIDWLVSGDDGEETFHERLKEDLEREFPKD